MDWHRGLCSVADGGWWQTHPLVPHHFHSHSWSRSWPRGSPGPSSSVSEPQPGHRSWTQQLGPLCQSLEEHKKQFTIYIVIVYSLVWIASHPCQRSRSPWSLLASAPSGSPSLERWARGGSRSAPLLSDGWGPRGCRPWNPLLPQPWPRPRPRPLPLPLIRLWIND